MSPSGPTAASVDVLNLRGQRPRGHDTAFQDQIIHSLAQSEQNWIIDENGGRLHWSKSLPISVLYEGDGIRLYDAITHSDGYYLYREEITILRDNADEIVSEILDASSIPDQKRTRQDSALGFDGVQMKHGGLAHLNVVDLGAGRPDKALVLLESMHRQINALPTNHDRIAASYYAVDLQYHDLCARLANALASKSFLCNRNESPDQPSGKDNIAVHGICAPYVEALQALQDQLASQQTRGPACSGREQRKCLLWLGSSFTNFEPEAAVSLLRSFVHVAALGPGDCILIGIDSCQDPARLAAAYGSQSTHWRKYAQNGIRNAGKILGGSAAFALQDARDWEYVARWDALRKRHVRFVKASRALSFETSSSYDLELNHTIKIARGEHIFLSQSYKYSQAELRLLFRDAGLAAMNEWRNERGDGSVYLLQKAC